MNSAFSEQILADKLSKLNSTQQCIETLSHWCIYHRKNADQVVQTWERQFHNAQKEQKTAFLYLANDILQNSKKTGTEFVGEFWKVLPGAVKDVTENGDEHGKSVVSRLVNIWEERRVFGSRARNLKDLMLGSDPLPTLELNKKRSRSGSVKIMRRDSRSLKIKLSIGGTAEKIVSAIHAVTSEHPDEDTDLENSIVAVRRLEKIEKDVEIACARVGDPRRATLAEEIKEEESSLQQCIEKIKSIESSRAALVSQLKEALREQESYLESVRTQLQVAEGQLDQAANMRRRLNNEPTPPPSTPVPPPPKPESNGPSTSDSKKTAAAAIADKLAASTHSQQIMTSVLSTFAAEANKNTNPKPENNSVGLPANPAPPMPQYNFFTSANQQYLQPPQSGVMIGLPYSYSAVPPPPAPPPPTAQLISMVRPVHISPQQPQIQMLQAAPSPQAPIPQPIMQPQVQFMQQPPLPSYRPLQPPNLGFYPHQTQ